MGKKSNVAHFRQKKKASEPLDKGIVNTERLERLREEIAVCNSGLTNQQIPLLNNVVVLCTFRWHLRVNHCCWLNSLRH